MINRLLTAAETALDILLFAFFLLLALLSLLALSDDRRINAGAGVSASIAALRPEEDSPGFEELLLVNPDVRGWLTLPDAGVDCPILQGETNLAYINLR